MSTTTKPQKPLSRDQKTQAERVFKWVVSFQLASERLLTEHPELQAEFPDLVEALHAVEPIIKRIRWRLIQLMRAAE